MSEELSVRDQYEATQRAEYDSRNRHERVLIFGGVSGGTILILGLIVLCMWGCPRYSVYSARKEGEAALAHAQYSKEVAVAESKAKMEASRYEAEADTTRAHGIARSNQIIGGSLKENKEYLQWLWIDNLNKNQVIYVPTEANMPIMEASRFMKGQTTTPIPTPTH